MVATGLPIVRHYDYPKRPDMIDIAFDDRKIGTMAAEWFLRRGFKNFAYCGSHGSIDSDEVEKAFGTTAGKYITSVKMREAKRLLDENQLNVKEVALRTGFSSPQYFSHAYHDFYGHSPIGRQGRQ